MLKVIFNKSLIFGGCAVFALFTPLFGSPVFAQIAPPKDQIQLPPPEPVVPERETPREDLPDGGNEAGGENSLEDDKAESSLQDFVAPQTLEKPDYSRISAKSERTARLDALFVRLKAAEDESAANLIAEDIWALWLESGSASVNLVLRRGADAQSKNRMKAARRLYDETTKLKPKFAEGWARSSRLALEDKNLSRALNEAAKTLVLEPRHFYALWTMGNVFEQLGRDEEALEAYREANALHPQLKAVKDRLDALESDINGDVL